MDQTTQGAGTAQVDITRAVKVTPEVQSAIDQMFTYQPWSTEQEVAGTKVRNALAAATQIIVDNVPPSPDRTVAIRKLREARMDCNSAITFQGRY